MKQMRGNNKKVAYLILIVNLIQLTIQQQASLSTQNLLNDDASTIQFKQGDTNSPHIQFKETQYSFNPQIDQDYSIVHTVVYPLASNPRQKFISSVPKDSFVNKLNHQNPPNSDTNLNQDKQKNSQSQKSSSQQKEIQKKAQEILKQQTIEQQAKLKEQKIISQKTNKNPTNQQKAEVSKEDLFAQKTEKSHQQIQKTENKIKFKEHEIAKPLPITTYAFETKNLPQKMKSEQAKTSSQTSQQPKQQVKKPSPQQQKPKTQTKEIKSPQRQTKTQKQKEPKLEKQNKKESQKSILPQKKEKIVEDKNAQSKPTNKPSNEKQQSQKQGMNPESIEQFKKLTKSLSTGPQKIKNSLQFEAAVKQEIQKSEWGYLVAKVLIGLTILISIYQATCSSESQEKKIEKGKYSPVGLSQVDTENALDMTERPEYR